ncbi:MAG: alpha/beta hydrolase [Gammaproteobacteria bacterium]|nr:alpha/beta hydrolase [Gammaproteobacteria bacterium]
MTGESFQAASFTPEQTREVSVRLADGTDLHGLLYLAEGETVAGYECLCIHGLGVDANIWRFVAPRLSAAGFNVLCLDLRGHGLSGGGSWVRMSPNQMGQDLFEALQKLRFGPRVILAQFFGARVALGLLSVLPKQVRPPLLIAVTPVWTARRKSFTNFARITMQTLALLAAIRKQTEVRVSRTRQRRDHIRFAGQPDFHMPRFVEEAGSITWPVYARLLAGMHLHDWISPDLWEAHADWPVCIVGATDEGLWDNTELEEVSRRTAWPLHWLRMRHVSLSTEPEFAGPFVQLLLQCVNDSRNRAG